MIGFQINSLNSTMVRLKPIHGLKISKLSPASQFHYGSIKTLKTFNFQVRVNKSQFHYGSIKTIDEYNKYAPNIVVSIPLWFD